MNTARPSLTFYSKPIESVFELLGRDENAMTFALGWCLSRVPEFLDALADLLGEAGKPRLSASHAALRLQEYRAGRGVTDLEIHVPDRLVWIIEAKQGFVAPDTTQLQKYAQRLAEVKEPDVARRLIVLAQSDRRGTWLQSTLPPQVDGIPVSALSWRDVQQATAAARATTGRVGARLLDDFTGFLKRVAPMKDETSNMVYVVALGRDNFNGTNLNSIDAVERHGRYFHPLGGDRSGWPVNPPNYLGFRYDGHLQSIHHVEDYEIITDLTPHFPAVPSAAIPPHVLYHLGPPIRPAHPVPTGGRLWATRMYCFIDTLLTSSTIVEAQQRTARRW